MNDSAKCLEHGEKESKISINSDSAVGASDEILQGIDSIISEGMAFSEYDSHTDDVFLSIVEKARAVKELLIGQCACPNSADGGCDWCLAYYEASKKTMLVEEE